MLSQQRHAWLARELISACGGLIPAAQGCRLGKSRLAEFQNPLIAASMPADVMNRLETMSGDPLYSREMAATVTEELGAAEQLLAETCAATEKAAELQAAIRNFDLTKPLTRQRREVFLRLLSDLEGHVRRVEVDAEVVLRVAS